MTSFEQVDALDTEEAALGAQTNFRTRQPVLANWSSQKRRLRFR